MTLPLDFFFQNKTHILYLAQRGPEVLNGILAPAVLKARWKKGLSKRTGTGDSRAGTHVNIEGSVIVDVKIHASDR